MDHSAEAVTRLKQVHHRRKIGRVDHVARVLDIVTNDDRVGLVGRKTL